MRDVRSVRAVSVNRVDATQVLGWDADGSVRQTGDYRVDMVDSDPGELGRELIPCG